METQIKKGVPKDVFLHLLAAATLYASAVALIALWWQYINILFPDLLQNQGLLSYTNYYDPIRLAMAVLMVVFPVHILISWLLGKEFKADPEKREIPARKWLWYITLFISAVTIIVDLVILVNNFLRGELTTQFFLKIFTVLAVAGAVFGYYLWDLKKRRMPTGKPKIIAWVAAIVILAGIIYGFFLIGTPATQRARRFDEQRTNDLSALQNEITNFWIQKAKLPTQLDDLENQTAGLAMPLDPMTHMPYEYAVDGPLNFKLCADFQISNMLGEGGMMNGVSVPMPRGVYRAFQQNWTHGAGHMCFERTIDPQLYKPEGVPVPPK